jgi:choline dehydrogenase
MLAPKQYYQLIRNGHIIMAREFDYVIVGGGSAGCVAAWRLTTEKKARVLLLERGPAKATWLRQLMLQMPAAWMMAIKGNPVVEMHKPVPQKHLNGRAPSVGQANVLGGGTSVNAMVYTRGQREDYDAWNNLLGENGGWAYADMLKAFKAIENNQRFDDVWHSVGGPQPVSDTAVTCQITRDYIAAVQKLGVAHNADFNGEKQAGVGTMQYTHYKKRRYNAVEAFLKPALQTGLLTIQTDCVVSRLMIQNATCVGVEYTQNGEQKKVHAGREVLVASGTFQSPKLLMLSGIGPADELWQHGISVVVDLPGVGQNLQDHHEVPVVAATNGHYGYYGEDKGWRAVKNGLQYFLFKSGPVTSVGVEACAYIDPDGGTRPKIKMYCVPTVYLDGDIVGVKQQDGVTLNACLLRPQSRGTVKLRSANPLDQPIIDNNYLGDPDDLRLEIAGLRYARDILKQQPINGRVTMELLPGKDVTSDHDLAEHCRRTVKTNWHPVGTCRMGRDSDPLAVLDSKLRVRNIKGLRVIDASTMPLIPSGNTNAPTMAVAYRAVDGLE